MPTRFPAFVSNAIKSPPADVTTPWAIPVRGHFIDCRMPLGKSNAVNTAAGSEQQQATFRSHRIAIYSDATLEPAEKCGLNCGKPSLQPCDNEGER
jgi:hypothetical protein